MYIVTRLFKNACHNSVDTFADSRYDNDANYGAAHEFAQSMAENYNGKHDVTLLLHSFDDQTGAYALVDRWQTSKHPINPLCGHNPAAPDQCDFCADAEPLTLDDMYGPGIYTHIERGHCGRSECVPCANIFGRA